MTRPARVVAVVGTATEIGKTWVGAALARELIACGKTVAARKPVQSFDPTDDGPTDAAVLASATGESVDRICPQAFTYPVPMAPPMAADVLGRPGPMLDDLLAAVVWPERPVDVGLVETVGGVRSPVAVDGDSRALAAAVTPDRVLLVAHAGLGTINDVRLAVDALSPLPVVVHLNRFDASDDLHERNRRWLADRDGLEVVVSVEELGVRLAS